MATIDLSLISHTNIGKTTLARTLLRREVGDIRDSAHVTDAATAYTLIDSPAGDTLRLWDTPGFGDSARLLRRLEKGANPIGWFLTQAWDRYTDRPFSAASSRCATCGMRPTSCSTSSMRRKTRRVRVPRPGDAHPRLDGETGYRAAQPARCAAPGRADGAGYALLTTLFGTQFHET